MEELNSSYDVPYRKKTIREAMQWYVQPKDEQLKRNPSSSPFPGA